MILAQHCLVLHLMGKWRMKGIWVVCPVCASTSGTFYSGSSGSTTSHGSSDFQSNARNCGTMLMVRCKCLTTTGRVSVHLMIQYDTTSGYWCSLCILRDQLGNKNKTYVKDPVSHLWVGDTRTTSRGPTWSLTVVLTGPNNAWLLWGDWKWCYHFGMIVPTYNIALHIQVQQLRSKSQNTQTNSMDFFPEYSKTDSSSHDCNNIVLQTNTYHTVIEYSHHHNTEEACTITCLS